MTDNTTTTKVSRISHIVSAKGVTKDTLERMEQRIRRSIDNAMKLGQFAKAGQTDGLAKLHDEYLMLCAEIRSLKEDIKAMEARKASLDEEIDAVEV